MGLFMLGGGLAFGYAAWKHTPVFDNPVLTIWLGFWMVALVCAFMLGRKNGNEVAAIAIAQAKAVAEQAQAQSQSVQILNYATTPGLQSWLAQYGSLSIEDQARFREQLGRDAVNSADPGQWAIPRDNHNGAMYPPTVLGVRGMGRSAVQGDREAITEETP